MTRIAGVFVAFGLIAYAFSAALSITASEIALLIAFAGAIVLWLRRTPAPHDRTVAVALAIYLVLKLVTVLASVDVARSLRDYYHYWPFLLFLVVPLAVRTGPRRIILYRALAIGVIVASVYALFQHFSGHEFINGHTLVNPHGRYRALGFFSHHLTWAGFALVAALFLGGLRPASRRDRILIYAAAALALFGMLATYSRGPMAGLAAGIVLYLVMGKAGRKTAAAGVLVFLVAWAVTPNLLGRFKDTVQVDLNPDFSESRTGIWLTAWAIGKTRPLVGVGPGNFEAAFAAHRINPGLLIAGHAHNQWLDEWATSGALGVIGFSLLWLAVALALWRRRRRPDGAPMAALAAWVAIAAASLFECHFSDEEVLMLALFVAALGLLPEPDHADER